MDVSLPLILPAWVRSEHFNRNVWTPTAQAPVIGVIGEHYGFTRRLQAIVTMPPPEAAHKKEKPPAQRPSTARVSMSRSPVSDKGIAMDVELGSVGVNPPSKTPEGETSKDLAIYHLVKDTMGFTSVDQGEQCKYPAKPDLL